MTIKRPQFILTDIEGTTSSISFVAEELFPYFRSHIHELKLLRSNPLVEEAFQQTVSLAQLEDGETLENDEQIIAKLHTWSVEDRKITPLKTLQGILWEKGYQDGTLKGHVYEDVQGCLEQWKKEGIRMGVFSSGSVAAQKLLFGYSVAGDLTPFFSAYFDTTTGTKRDIATYVKIAEVLNLPASEILFLSDIYEELEAADKAGFQTVQLARAGMMPNWKQYVTTFSDLVFK